MPRSVLIRPLLACLTALLLLATPAPVRADFALPPLPYAADALEPAIDATTMAIHHDRHHGAYVANLNARLKADPTLAAVDLEALQAQISRFPEAVRNNGGGHWNHSQFWAVMAPAAQGRSPSQPLLAAIDEALAAQPDVADKIRSGKVQAAGAIVGAVMKSTRGQADAGKVRALLLERLGVSES